jgi:membrane protease YdiL (CAAX protease family)
MKFRMPRGLSALLEVGLMFLPAIPAYLWLWPNVEGMQAEIAQLVTYGYILAGTLFIGRRRWSWEALGMNRKGLGLSLGCGLALLGGRLLVILAVEWGGRPAEYSPLAVVGQVLYYIGVVGLVEELLFRGLIYRALEEWRSVRWAIWGSTIGFMLWHISGHGPLIAAATFVIGLVFALLRWRGGGILGLIVLHGLWDLQAVLLVSDSNAKVLSWGRPEIPHLGWMLVGLGLMVSVPVYLWVVYPRLRGRD